jgi:flagella basal body P-ring formation protein FlgA
MHSWALVLPFLLRLLAAVALCALPVHAVQADESPLQQQVRRFAATATPEQPATRVEVQVGALDPRLRLAPCEEVQPYLPPNARMWGRTRIGVRCLRGPTRWNVFLPVTVKVYAKALVATRALPVGSTLAEADLAQAEVDLAEEASHALLRPEQAVGRTLARPLDMGRSVRSTHLQARQWFAAGDTVQVVAQGSGFRVAAEGQALTPGTEGIAARIRTESGRILSAEPVGDRRVEVKL